MSQVAEKNEVFYPLQRYGNSYKGKPVEIGQKVYCSLYGGSYGIVVAIHGEQKPASIGSLAGFISTGGSAYFDIVFSDHKSLKLPESILHGVQWEVFPDVASDEDIEIAKAVCEAAISAKKAAENAKADAQAKLAEELKVQYSHLIQIAGSNMSPGKCAAKNIRTELKAAFPKVKFKVTSDYDSVRVSYDDGPALDKVKAICNKYQAGHFDCMHDIYEYSDSAVFAGVFGDPKYVFCSREISDENAKAAASIYCSMHNIPFGNLNDRVPEKLQGNRVVTYKCLGKQFYKGKDIPVGAKVVDLKRNDCKCACGDDYYSAFYDVIYSA